MTITRTLVVVITALLIFTPACANAATADDYQRMFDNKTDETWSAADNVASVPLPNGKVAWLFGDTIRKDNPWVHNSVLVQEGDSLTSTTGGIAIPDEPNGEYYWLSDGIWSNDRLRVFAGRVGNTPNGSFEGRGEVLASFKLDDRGYPMFVGMKNIDSPTGIQWGTSVTQRGKFAYIYGQRYFEGTWIFGRDVFVARTRYDRVACLNCWKYWDGERWSRDKSSAAAFENASTGRWASGFSVDRIGRDFYAVSKENDFIGDKILLMKSPRPYGPFTTVSSIPAAYETDDAWVYLARAHPEAGTSNGLVVSWNLMAQDFSRLSDPYFPKPKFGHIDLQ